MAIINSSLADDDPLMMMMMTTTFLKQTLALKSQWLGHSTWKSFEELGNNFNIFTRAATHFFVFAFFQKNSFDRPTLGVVVLAAGRVAGWRLVLFESMRTGANNWRGAPPPVGGRTSHVTWSGLDQSQRVLSELSVCLSLLLACCVCAEGEWCGHRRGAEWEGRKLKKPD